MKSTGTVLHKTAAGVTETQSRSLGLPRKTFSLLLAVDGRRTLEQMCETLSAYGDVAGQLADLHERGLIEAAESSGMTENERDTRSSPFTRTAMPTRAGPATVQAPGTRTDPPTRMGPSTRIGTPTRMGPPTQMAPAARPPVSPSPVAPSPVAPPAVVRPPADRSGSTSIPDRGPLGLADIATPAIDGAGRPAPLDSHPPPARAQSQNEFAEFRNLIDIRQYVAPQRQADRIDALREIMARSLGRSVDLESIDLLDAIERISTAEQLAKVLRPYLSIVAMRSSPADHKRHVEQLASVAGLEVEDFLAGRFTGLASPPSSRNA